MEEFECIEFPGVKFKTQLSMFHAIAKSQETIIGIKKAQKFQGWEKGQSQMIKEGVIDTIKSHFGEKEGFIYPIISTTKFYDRHGDVHFDGCFNKTLKEQQGKVVYTLDHELRYDAIVAWEKDVTMMIKNIDWSIVGKNYPGQTEALIFEIAKENIKRKDVLSDIVNKVSDFENSIRMVYHKIALGVNSYDKELRKEKKYYDKRINEIANKEAVEEVAYFWGVEELGIIKEGSLVVAGGSNSATSIFSKNEPLKNTREPLINTHKFARRRFA